jgi:hypothetical protein
MIKRLDTQIMYKSLGASKPKDVNKIAKCNVIWFGFGLSYGVLCHFQQLSSYIVAVMFFGGTNLSIYELSMHTNTRTVNIII